MRIAFLLLFGLFAWVPAAGAQTTPRAKAKVVFVTGDEEYRSEESMPMLAAILERDYDIDATVLYAVDERGEIAPNHLTNIPGLEALRDADLLVMFTRFRALPKEQFQAILDYAESGRPMVGFRTATHAFLYKDGPLKAWNDDFSIRFFGQKWITHHGHRSTTEVSPVAAAEHPILRGVESFDAPSWLYHVEGGGDALPADHVPLLRGRAVNSNHSNHDRFPLEQTVAWAREREMANGTHQRVFFTTLGHPYDFVHDSMRTLSLNGILWALGREAYIPAGGCAPETVLPFRPTQAQYGGAVPGRRPDSENMPHFVQMPPKNWEPKEGARITLVGGAYAERLAMDGEFESMLHRLFPDKRLIVRSLAWPGDTPGLQPRPLDYGSLEDHLTALQTDVVIACFGFNESFPHVDGHEVYGQRHDVPRAPGEAGVEEFQSELEAFLRRMAQLECSGGQAPEVILLEAQADWPHLNSQHPWLLEKQSDIGRTRDVLTQAAQRWALRCITSEHSPSSPTTARQLASLEHVSMLTRSRSAFEVEVSAVSTSGAHHPLEQRWPDALPSDPKLSEAIQAKHQQWFYRYRAVNGYYIYGGRKDPFGVVSFPGEMERLDAIVAQYDQRIWDIAQGKDVPDEIEFQDLPPLPKIETNFTKDIRILTPEEQLETFTVAEGYSVELVASEREFPELQNPVALTFDSKGRLWVSTMPSYPQVLPGTQPDDKLLIFEDHDRDGRADAMKVFADGLYLPGGFELGHNGAYVAQMPNLVFLPDENGDDRADEVRTVLRGFGTEDSHHAISAFVWDPGGGLHFQEGTFHHSQVETPWGPVRLFNGGVFRYEPTSQRLSVHAPWAFYNPWGHVFDPWGRDLIGDASDGSTYPAAPMMTQTSYSRSRRGLPSITKNQVRPTGGAELLTGPMFPEEVHGHYVVSNTIGFQGLRAHKLRPDGSAVYADESWDILSSSDPNFRPIDLQIGPDGALYFVDWFNPLIGHMQHSLRDPNRDHSHGRIWRVVYDGAELSEQPIDLTELSTLELIALLRKPETDDRLRYRIRTRWTELASTESGMTDCQTHLAAYLRFATGHLFGIHVQQRDPILSQIKKSVPELVNDEASHRFLLELLWLSQRLGGIVDVNRNVMTNEAQLLKRLLQQHSPNPVIGAIRILQNEYPNWTLARMNPKERNEATLPAPQDWLRPLLSDHRPNVRLEAIAAATKLGGLTMVEGVLEAAVSNHRTDRWLDYAISEALIYFQPLWQEALQGDWEFADKNPEAVEGLLDRLSPSELLALRQRPAVCKRLLLSPGIPSEVRREALDILGAAEGRIASEEWVAALERADETARDEAQGLVDLALWFESDDLAQHADRLKQRALEGRHPSVRTAAMAGWMQCETDAALWSQAQTDGDLLDLYLRAAALLESKAVPDENRPERMARIDQLVAEPTAWSGYPGDAPAVAPARYVRIDLPGKAPLTLAEVEVLAGGQNVARQGQASQSSTAWNGVASRAIDGDNHPSFGHGSQSHSAESEENSWWEVDLGQAYAVEEVIVWNRQEGQLGQRLQGFGLSLLDPGRRIVWEQSDNDAPERSAQFAIYTDWQARIRRAALHALAQSDQPATAATQILPSLMRAVPASERGADWYQDGLAILERSGLHGAVQELSVTLATIEFGPDGQPSTQKITAPAGTPVELRLQNQFTRQVNLVLLGPDGALPSETSMDPEGQRLFAMHCAACHKPDGAGLVGPNMTDDHFVRIQRYEDLEPLVRRGIPDKGMIAFENVLTDEQLTSVVRYTAALRGTTPKGGIAPVGEPIAPWTPPLDGVQGALAHSEILAPGASSPFRFTAPETPGRYRLICTLPHRQHLRVLLVVE